MKHINEYSEFRKSLDESFISEAKKYKAKDIIDAWKDAYGEDIMNSDHADVPDDIDNDYRGRVTIKDLEEIFDDRYGEELSPEFLEALGESVVTEATDMNDPVLVAFRATRRELPKFKPAKAKSRRLSFDKYMDLLDDQRYVEQELRDLTEEMAQTLRDMEQEAEPEGGKIADKYGSIMMKQEKEYAKLKAKKAKIDARLEKHRMD